MDSSDTSALFTSPRAFRQAFDGGLERLLEAGGLNLFILVCANAGFDAALFSALRDRLSTRYRELLDGLRQALADGRRIGEADDDLLVFLKMAALGFDALALTEQRKAGCWELQFNLLRSFRPLRNSASPVSAIHAPFDDRGFNFNKPFMQQETLWSGEMLGRQTDLYYNKYPFVDLHGLLVPERQRCLPQFLVADMHAYAWRLVRELAAGLPGVRIAYNALGAFASVNHLHLQLFVRDAALPVEDVRWKHNGGEAGYPVDCMVFEDPDAAWSCIERLHQANQAYNLLYTPRRLYCLVRKNQGTFELPEWSSGFSWYELCGGMITFNREAFRSLDAQRIEDELVRARCT